MPIELDAIRRAKALLASHFGTTPLVFAPSLSGASAAAYLKIETTLPTGSFKVRGAVYSLTMNTARDRPHEVVAASTGNHGAAVAFAGRLLGVPAKVFLPAGANTVKVDRIRDLGADIVSAGRDLSAAIDAAEEYAHRTGAFFLHDARDASVPVGAGTIGAEIVEQCPDVERIYVPVGDTALIRGVASATKQLNPSIQIIGVVAANAPAYLHSWQLGHAVSTDSADTIADGLAVRRPLDQNVSAIRALVDDMRIVSDDDLLQAMRHLHTHEGVVAEPSAAAPTAAFLQDSERARTTVLLVTGSNVAPEIAVRLPRDRP